MLPTDRTPYTFVHHVGQNEEHQPEQKKSNPMQHIVYVPPVVWQLEYWFLQHIGKVDISLWHLLVKVEEMLIREVGRIRQDILLA